MHLMKYFPCSPSSAAKYVAEDPVKAKDPINKEAGGVDIGPPTGNEYAGQAARGFLEVLEAISQAVPIPAFGAAVKIAANIIKACDDTQATLERAEDLKVRIKTLVAVFVNELKGKKEEEINGKLVQAIDNLNRDMKYIKETLDKISSQHCLLLIFFQTINDSRVSKCVTMVNNSLESFNLACTINHIKMLTQLEQQIMMFYTEQQGSLKILQVTMDGVKAMLDERLPGGMSMSPSRAPIPSNSAIFYGRDALVMKLVSVITGPLQKHICLFGPGGMGKTSTSLAVMGHPDVKAKYKDHLRVWVPCVKATSVSLFLDTLKLSLAISKETGDARGAIIKNLCTSPPIVILLDNFETPWDADGARSDIEQVLHDIHEIKHVTLFVTTRSSSLPCDDILWYTKDIHGVDEKSAREIYVAHHPEGNNDPDLSHLLELVSYMPLAVTLLAKVAKVIHLSAAELVEEYNISGTSMLGQGLDAKSSMDISIGLSVYSSPMKAHPEAFNLLCILSMLPTGTSFYMLSNWWACNLSQLVGALSVLKGASLVEERGSTYFVLPVIQRYILNPSRFNSEVQTSMIKTACAFLKQHKADFSDPLYKKHIAELSQEESNLETILLQVTTSDSHIIRDGLLLLAHYQKNNRPQVDIIEHALKLVQNLDDELLQGDILSCYGDISMNLSFINIDKCLQHFKKALDLFLSVPDRKRAAETYLAINHALAFHPNVTIESRLQAIREAQINFQAINDESGIGCCELALGELGWQYSTVEETFAITLSSLEMAEEIFAEINNLSLHAVSTIHLALFYYRTCQYNLANSWAASSLKECQSIGYSIGSLSALRTLGQIASAQGDYEGSLQQFIESIKVGKSLGLPPSGDALEGMGVAWSKLGKVIDAHKAFKEALHQHSSEEPTRNTQHDILRIQFLSKHLENFKLSPNIDEFKALQKMYSQDHLDKILTIL